MNEPRYTVFIRVPIPRGDFVDPPPVDWDSAKDDALWQILSGAGQKEIDWNHIATQFDVTVDFLLQQVAYLTDRHASQVRAQVRKATAAAKSSAAPSPVPMMETPSAQQHRAASAFSAGRDSPMTRTDSNNTTATFRPAISRGASTNTAVLHDHAPASPRPGPRPLPSRGSTDTIPKGRVSSIKTEQKAQESPLASELELSDDREVSPGPAELSSSESSEDESNPVESRIIRRPPRFKQQEAQDDIQEEDEDNESEPAFQPYVSPDKTPDLGSTLRGDGRSPAKASSKTHPHKKYLDRSHTSDSSNGSGAAAKRGAGKETRTTGPFSPRRRAEVAAQGSPGKGKGTSQDGSEGTPSMGSSFSDLDDASVTQSALEEALASHLQGGASSRFSISQAFRSRYTPGSSKQ